MDQKHFWKCFCFSTKWALKSASYCKSNGKPKLQMHLSPNYDFVFTNLLKNETVLRRSRALRTWLIWCSKNENLRSSSTCLAIAWVYFSSAKADLSTIFETSWNEIEKILSLDFRKNGFKKNSYVRVIAIFKRFNELGERWL